MESSSSALNLRKQLEFLSENCCAGKTETWKSFLWTEILFPLKILAHQCQPAFLSIWIHLSTKLWVWNQSKEFWKSRFVSKPKKNCHEREPTPKRNPTKPMMKLPFSLKWLFITPCRFSVTTLCHRMETGKSLNLRSKSGNIIYWMSAISHDNNQS